MAEQSEGCTCGSEGPDEFGNYDQIVDPDCPVHGSDTDPSPDPVLSRVAAERDHYKQRVEDLEAEYQGIIAQEEIWIEPRVKQSRREAMAASDRAEAAEQRVGDLEERLRNAALDAGHYVEQLARVREWAEDYPADDRLWNEYVKAQQHALSLLEQTDERKSEPFIPAVDTRDLVPASLLSEIADTLDARADRQDKVAGKGKAGHADHGHADGLREAAQLVRDHSTPEQGCTCTALRNPPMGWRDPNCPVHSDSTPEEGKE